MKENKKGGIYMKKTNIFDLAICAIATALVYVFTAFINVRLPIGGEGGIIHLGNIPLFIFAIICGKKIGMICGGIGMALFDLMSGWATWAPFTLIIVGAMGFVVGAFAHKKTTYLTVTIGIILAIIIKVVGYYFAELIIFGNPITPFSSIPGNIIQVGFAGIVTLVAFKPVAIATKNFRKDNALTSEEEPAFEESISDNDTAVDAR